MTATETDETVPGNQSRPRVVGATPRSEAGQRKTSEEERRRLPGTETLTRIVDATRSLGEQTAFYGNALGATVDAVRRYPG